MQLNMLRDVVRVLRGGFAVTLADFLSHSACKESSVSAEMLSTFISRSLPPSIFCCFNIYLVVVFKILLGTTHVALNPFWKAPELNGWVWKPSTSTTQCRGPSVLIDFQSLEMLKAVTATGNSAA